MRLITAFISQISLADIEAIAPMSNIIAVIFRTSSWGQWISLNANFFRGGATTIDGSGQDTEQENSRWGITYALPLSLKHSLKFYANTGVITRIGNDFDTIGVAWQYRFEG